MTEQAISGFKGFDKDLKCRGFQFAIGETFKEKSAVICQKGFHFCENALDVLGYYGAADSRFATVTGSGKTAGHTEDSKIVCSELHVEAEISLSSLLGAGVKFILDKVDWENKKETNTGNRSAATNTGYRSAATNTGNGSAATNTGYGSAATNTGNGSAATNTGDGSAATNTGDGSAATVEGKESIACGLGYGNKARGAIGCWLVLADRRDDYTIRSVRTVKVDGRLRSGRYPLTSIGSMCRRKDMRAGPLIARGLKLGPGNRPPACPKCVQRGRPLIPKWGGLPAKTPLALNALSVMGSNLSATFLER